MTEPEDNGFATAEQLNAAGKRKRRYKPVDLPASGLRVRIQSLKESELSHYQTVIVSQTGRGFRRERMEDATRRLLVLCLVDGVGNRLYADADADTLGDWDSLDTQHLYNECTRHCGIDREDIEALVKNSGQTLVDA